MKCPHCQEEVGINNICINVACSYFGTEINFSDKSSITDSENKSDNKSDNKNSTSTLTNTYNYNANPNLNNKYTNGNTSGYNRNNEYANGNDSSYNRNNKYANGNDSSYNRNNYTNDQSTNKATSKSFYNNISREEFATFFGSNNTEYYLKYVPKIENNNKFVSWNWPCFFLTFYWLLYRKLYIPATVFLVLNLILSLLFSSLLALPIRIILTMYANALYLNNSVNKINLVKVNMTNLNTTEYISRLKKKGGVNLAAPLILIGIYIVVIILAVVFFMLFKNSVNPIHFSSPSYSS